MNWEVFTQIGVGVFIVVWQLDKQHRNSLELQRIQHQNTLDAQRTHVRDTLKVEVYKELVRELEGTIEPIMQASIRASLILLFLKEQGQLMCSIETIIEEHEKGSSKLRSLSESVFRWRKTSSEITSLNKKLGTCVRKRDEEFSKFRTAMQSFYFELNGVAMMNTSAISEYNIQSFEEVVKSYVQACCDVANSVAALRTAAQTKLVGHLFDEESKHEMNVEELEGLKRRLQFTETRNYHLQLGFVALSVVVIVASAIMFTRTSPARIANVTSFQPAKVIRTQHLEIVGTDGLPKAEITADKAALSIRPFITRTTRSVSTGLRGVYPVAVALPNEAKKIALTESDIEKAVKMQLRSADVKILTKDEWFTSEKEPTLYIWVNLLDIKDGRYAYTVRLEFEECVKSATPPHLWLLATTWESDILGCASGSVCKSSIIESIQKLTDDFTRQFLKQNPNLKGRKLR